MHLQDKPKTWILGGIIIAIIGYAGLNVLRTSGIIEAIFNAMAVGGWILLIIGIVKIFRKKKVNTN